MDKKNSIWSKYSCRVPLKPCLVLQIQNVVKLYKAEQCKSEVEHHSIGVETRLSSGVADKSKNEYLIFLLTRFWTFLFFFHDRETFFSVWRASWRMLGVLGSSPIPPWVFSSIHGCFPPFGVGEEDGLLLGDGDANGRHNWSIEWLSRILGNCLHLLFGFHVFLVSSICKP